MSDAEDSYEMVQTYGTADAQADSRIDGAEVHTREDDALLGANAMTKQPLRDGTATMTSSVGNLANTIIGSGECGSDVIQATVMLTAIRNVDIPLGMTP